jgi:hypothetical protein
MSDNLKAAAFAAGLSPEEQQKIDSFNKALTVHRQLSNLPADVAKQKYDQLPANQQDDLVKNFGNEDPVVKPKRGFFGTAWHYTGGAVGNALGYTGSHIIAGLGNVSDVMTRAYRTAAIAADQGLSLGDAWTTANDKGDKVFSPDRILDAKAKFGQGAVDVAMRIASKEDPEKILASVSPELQKYVMLADPRNTKIPGINDGDIEAARANFQDTLDAVNAAKYSPGRQIANLVTPSELEGSGLFYKAVSGTVDAAYRVLADPTLLAGKAKRFYDVTNYALDVVVGGGKVEEYFAKPAAQQFWNQYGAVLDDLNKAQAAGKTEDIIAAKDKLHILAPQFGDEVIKTFQTAPGGGVVDALTAKAFLLNAKQSKEMIKAGIGRQRVILPVMSPQQKLRIAVATTGNKIKNLDEIGPKFTDNYWFGGSTDADGIAKTIIDGKEAIVQQVKDSTNFKGISRFSTKYIQYKIDRARAKLTLSPMFEKEVFDVTAPDASDKIYRLAVMVMPTRDAKMLATAFDTVGEVGKRKDMYYGLWGTIAEIRGLNTNLPGQQIVRYLTGKNAAIHGIDDAFREKGSMPSDFSNLVAAPGIKDLDRAAARNTLFQKTMGLANSDLANKMNSAWSFLTLAGPRYAIRNAGEDLMVNLAIGMSPWGLAKNRMLSTRVNTYLQAVKKVEGSDTWFNNPLGLAMRMANKKEVNKTAAELTALKNKFDTGQAELATLRRELNAAKGAKDEALVAIKTAEIQEIENGLKGGITTQAREIFAATLTSGRVNRWRAQLGLKPANEEEAAILREQILDGDLENAISVASEGGLNMVTGNDYITRAVNLEKQTGTSVHALTYSTPSGKTYVKKPGERAYDFQALNQLDEGSMISWMMSMSRYANDEMSTIAVANLDEEKIAVDKMVAWMTKTKAGKQFLSDARLSNDMSADEIAKLNFKRAKDLFSKRDKSLNEELLNKIRVKDANGEWKVSGNLSLDDLPTNPDDIPAVIIGPTLVPAVEAERITSNVMSNGWTFLGLANARMSRQPIVLQEMVNIRKTFKKSGFEDAWISSYTNGIDPENLGGIAAATARAKKDLALVVEERALGQTLAYVDNPLVRTQLAFASRNFARFYRATEDFYRRMYRVVKYNPEALAKAALTYEGVTHSGWIQQDDQGNDYFVYPGIAPVYNAVQTTLDKLGIGNEFKTPFPVEFGAQVKMLTPSLNPDSLIPTFSGPLAGASVTVISSLVNIFNPGAADTIKGYALGKYSVDQPVLSALLPAHINRLYAAMNTDERNSQYASAWRKAVTYLEASGHGIPKNYDADGNLIAPTPAELEQYRLAVKNTTMSILGMRFAFGFFAPASPQVQLKSDMAQWISDNGRANFKQLFNKLLDQYPGDYNAAMAKWVELYPNEIPFTVTESERKSIAPLRYSQEAGNFVDQNGTLFQDYPSAAAFLIPHKSGFSWDTYKTLKDSGLIQNKRVEDYLREVQTASDLQQYYDKKNEFETALTNSSVDFERTQLRKEFDSWKSVFFAGRPLVAEELSQGSQKAIDRLRTLDELKAMLDANIGVRPKTESALRDMMNVYEDYKTNKDSYDQFGGSQALQKILKDETIVKLREMSNYNENTRAAYDVLFGRLLGD